MSRSPRTPDDPPGPSRSAATNLMIADVVLRSASVLVRKNVEKRIAKASAKTEQEARAMLDGRTLITTVALYGASRLATRSPVGLGVVAGALALKTLYDRGKSIERREARDKARSQ
ncbi:MAG: hypothetical protein V2I27_11995 [Erythrobacter sp.]|nr:hypothetical protein [Erythrobacter sp.]